MNGLPDYINCNNKEILVCDYYMTPYCPGTCAYARDIGALGCGGMSREDMGRLEKEIKGSQKSHNG